MRVIFCKRHNDASSATNIFTITKYSGMDPEVIANDERASGIDNGTYPTMKQISVGANITF